MNLGSTTAPSQTIYTKPRHGLCGLQPKSRTNVLATPAASMPILTATSGAPAAPAGPSLGPLSFAAKLSVTNA